MDRIDRRRFLALTQVALAAGAAPALALPTGESLHSQGAPVRPYGARAPGEAAQRLVIPARYPTATASLTPLQALDGTITPAALHFERHHAGVPALDRDSHRLLVHGLVRRPLVFSMAELQRFPQVSRIHFIECSGNTASEWPGPTAGTAQETHGLTSCSEWTGVALRTVLEECGVEDAAAWIVAEGADGAAMTRSVPLAKCRDDCLLAYAQNGEALRPEQGYPLRLLVPGWEGNINVKWLRRLKLVAAPYQTREETARYTDLLPDGTARQFSFVMETKSVITSPSGGQRLAAPGAHEIRGLAWSGRGRVARVEVTTDGGASWQEARLQTPVLVRSHTRFTLPWRWPGEAAVIASRCTDETGAVQPTGEALLAERGVHSYYHYNGIQAWRVAPDGAVSRA